LSPGRGLGTGEGSVAKLAAAEMLRVRAVVEIHL
jgi:hypothetical protein